MTTQDIKSAELCPVTITEEALLQFRAAYSDDSDPDMFGIRIGVKGGGCSGFMHILECIKQDAVDPEEDSVYLVGGLHFVIDCFSEPYLKGTTVDYLRTLLESGFKFRSDEVRRTCGCGASFSK
jgi:iron-sulfur cluster assembly protein